VSHHLYLPSRFVQQSCCYHGQNTHLR
jgi:hypothetical protein